MGHQGRRLTATPDDETIAALVRLAGELPGVDADEALRRLEGLTTEQRAIVEQALGAIDRSVRPSRGVT